MRDTASPQSTPTIVPVFHYCAFHVQLAVRTARIKPCYSYEHRAATSMLALAMCGHSHGSRNREAAAPQTHPCCQLSTNWTIYISLTAAAYRSSSRLLAILVWNRIVSWNWRHGSLRSTSRTLSIFTSNFARPDSANGLTPAPTAPLTAVRVICVQGWLLIQTTACTHKKLNSTD